MKSKRKVTTMHIDTRELIITNIIPNGGAGFAMCQQEECDVFISNHLLEGTGIDVGDLVKAIVVPNNFGKASTPYKAIRIDLLKGFARVIEEIEPDSEPDELTLQERVLELLEGNPDDYFTVNEIMEELELDIGHNEVLYSCDGLHSIGSICKASVWAPNYTKKSTFNLYSKNITAFAVE
jgi:hypothetical protein